MIYQQKDTLCTYRSHTIDIDIQKYLPFLQVSIRKLSMVQFHILSIPGWFCKASDKTHSDPPSCKPHFNARKNGIPIIDSMDATHKAIFESCPSESGIFGWSDLSIYIYILYISNLANIVAIASECLRSMWWFWLGPKFFLKMSLISPLMRWGWCNLVGDPVFHLEHFGFKPICLIL